MRNSNIDLQTSRGERKSHRADGRSWQMKSIEEMNASTNMRVGKGRGVRMMS